MGNAESARRAHEILSSLDAAREDGGGIGSGVGRSTSGRKTSYARRRLSSSSFLWSAASSFSSDDDDHRDEAAAIRSLLDDDVRSSDPGEEPELYSLVRRGRECDWSTVRDRLERIGAILAYLRRLVADSRKKTDVDADVERGVRGRGRRHALGPLLREYRQVLWSHPSSGVTAFHVAACWNPPPDVVRSFLSLSVPEVGLHLGWTKSDSGATPLHCACGNAAGADIVREILDGVASGGDDDDDDEEEEERAERSTSEDGAGAGGVPRRGTRNRSGGGKETYALVQTRDRGYTALHCAASSNSSLEVMEVLIEANPYAALVQDRDGKTPLEILCGSYGHFLGWIATVAETLRQEEGEKEEGEENENAASSGRSGVRDHRDEEESDLIHELPKALKRVLQSTSPSGTSGGDEMEEPMLHFWTRATLLLRTSASLLCGDGGRGATANDSSSPSFRTNRNVLHAACFAPSPPNQSVCPTALLEFLSYVVPEQLRQRDGPFGDLPLHLLVRDGLRRGGDDDGDARGRRPSRSDRAADADPTGTTEPAEPTNGGGRRVGPSTVHGRRWRSSLDLLLRRYPRAAERKNGRGMAPLEVLARSEYGRRRWRNDRTSSSGRRPDPSGERVWSRDGPLRRILDVHPPALHAMGLPEGLYPRALSKIGSIGGGEEEDGGKFDDPGVGNGGDAARNGDGDDVVAERPSEESASTATPPREDVSNGGGARLRQELPIKHLTVMFRLLRSKPDLVAEACRRNIDGP